MKTLARPPLVDDLETVWADYDELQELFEFVQAHPQCLDPLDNINDCGTCGIAETDMDHRQRWHRYDELRRDLGLVRT